MSDRQAANGLLDAVREGADVPLTDVLFALLATGDLTMFCPPDTDTP